MTQVTYAAAADQKTFAITFPYLNASHILVTVRGGMETDWTVAAGNVVLGVDVVISEGDSVVLQRVTPKVSLLGTFAAPSTLRAAEVERVAKQLLYILQEEAAANLANLATTPAGTAWDAEDLEILRVGAPTAGSSAATKSYVDNAIVTSGSTPVPDETDVGKGLRVVDAGGGNYGFTIASVDGATRVFRIPKGPGGSDGRVFGYEVEKAGLIGDQWASLGTDTEVPLEVEHTLGTPDAGLVTIGTGNKLILPSGGKWAVEVRGNLRNLTATTDINSVRACAGITNVSGATVHDQIYVISLGQGGGTTTAAAGLPQFPWQTSCPVSLFSVIDTTAGPQEIVIRLSASVGEHTIADYPFRVFVSEIVA